MNRPSTSKVALVTGANVGVGFAICQRLLQKFPDMKLCLCCRNKENAEKAAEKLRARNPKSEVSTILLDTSSIKSVYRASAEIRTKFDHIDWLYLNAGTCKVVGIDWAYLINNFFTRKLPQMLAKGEGLLLHEDHETEDGLKNVFETNLFGHYVLVEELKSLLERANEVTERPAQIIWTSSSNGVEYNFSLDDIQHKKGKEPYSSSKYAINVASVGLNERLNSKNVYSHVVCPGLMNTKLVHDGLPPWSWPLLLPFMLIMRFFVPSLTISPGNGSTAAIWLCEQNPASLGPNHFFSSSCSGFGKLYVHQQKMDISTEKAESLLAQLDTLNDSFKDIKLNLKAEL